MNEEKIRVKISDDGEVNLEVIGVKGKGCLDLTEALEKELGIVTDRTKKREYDRPARVTTQNVSNIHRGRR